MRAFSDEFGGPVEAAALRSHDAVCDEQTATSSIRASFPKIERPRRISVYNYSVGFVLLDALLLCGAGFALADIASVYRQDPQPFALWQIDALIGAVILYLSISLSIGVYRTETIFSARHVIRQALSAFAATLMVLLVLAVATKTAETYSRLWFFSWAASSALLIAGSRFVVLKRVDRFLREGACVHTAHSIGVCGPAIDAVEIARHSRNQTRVRSTSVLENVDDLPSHLDQIVKREIDDVYIVAPWLQIPSVLEQLDSARHISAKVFVLPAERGLLSTVPNVSLFGGRPSFQGLARSIDGWGLWLKRLEDLLIATVALTLLFPLMLLAAAAIRLDSPGPIFFRQLRIGFNGKTFYVWKFRSMFAHQTDPHAERQTSRSDPRVTPIGRFIRRTSIDELPQLFNVLEGTMSLVGPRPHALMTKAEGRNLEELFDQFAARHRVKPGMTGLAQVRGFRGELDSVEKLTKRVESDLEYIEHWSPWLDVKIIFCTLSTIWRDPAAY